MHTILGIAFVVWMAWVIWDINMWVLYHLTPSRSPRNDDDDYYEE